MIELENNPLSHLSKISLQRLARLTTGGFSHTQQADMHSNCLDKTEEAARTSLAYTNNEINLERNHETCMCFSSVVGGATCRKIDDLSICPKNIILDLFLLLVVPYSWAETRVGESWSACRKNEPTPKENRISVIS